MVSIDLAVGRGARARAGPLTDISKEPAVVRSQGLVADRRRPLTRMYGPAVRCKRLWWTLADAVLRQCIRSLIGACAPGHHGYQRACDLISG